MTTEPMTLYCIAITAFTVLAMIDRIFITAKVQRLASDVSFWRKRFDTLERGRETAHQGFLEVAHAQECGPGWYTKGESGMYQQVRMWVERGLEATRKEG